MKQWFFNK